MQKRSATRCCSSIFAVSACGAQANDAGSTAARDQTAAASSNADGTLTLGSASYPFGVITCDPEGSGEDGVMLKARGSTPDGKAIAIEVERLTPGDVIWESALVVFGSIVDDNHWEARRVGHPDGRWFADDGMREAAHGALVGVSGRSITIEAPFKHSQGETRAAAIRVTCP